MLTWLVFLFNSEDVLSTYYKYMWWRGNELMQMHPHKCKSNRPLSKHKLYLWLQGRISCLHYLPYFLPWQLQEETGCPESPEPPLWGTGSTQKESHSLGCPPTADPGACTDDSSEEMEKEKAHVLRLIDGSMLILGAPNHLIGQCWQKQTLYDPSTPLHCFL